MRALQLFCCALLGLALTMSTTSSAQTPNLTFHLLHTFTGPPDGHSPNPLIRDAEGNLYGTTALGGVACANEQQFGCGTVFELAKNGRYTVLYSFLGGEDGDFPGAGLARDAAGNLYGTTEGINGSVSTIFKVDKNGTETVLFHFTNFADGALANTTPILDAMGNLYGTTYYGGDSACGSNGNGCGVVYELTATGHFSVLHTFTAAEDGMQPLGTLVMDSQGNLYGTTPYGGDCKPIADCGTIYRVGKSGKFTVLYRFTGQADGANPVCVIPGGAATLYGITDSGGTFAYGTMFKIEKPGRFKVLFEFPPTFPNNGGHNCLVRDSSGNLYGTNVAGSGAHSGGYLFELDTSGNFTDLFDFPIIESPDGAYPTGVLVAPNGDFYGNLDMGGDTHCGFQNVGCGTLFRLRR